MKNKLKVKKEKKNIGVMRKKIFTGYGIAKVYIHLTLDYMNSVRPEPRNCILFGYISLLFKCYLPT